MDTQKIVAELSGERNRLDRAIAALESLSQSGRRRGRPPKVSQAEPASGLKRRRMSAAARARIGCKESMVGKTEGQGGSQEGCSCPHEVDRSPPDECRHAEEIVGNDEG